MRTIGRIGLVACLAAFASATVQAGAPEGGWYLAPRVNALWVDDARSADDDVGYTLSFGHSFSENWDGELSVFQSSHETLGGGDTKLRGYGLSANRVFYRNTSRVNPFLTFGLARVKAESDLFGDQEETAATYGAGLLVDLSSSRERGRAVQLRADIGARRGMSTSGNPDRPVDYVAGLGIQLTWGGKTAPLDSDGDGVNDSLDNCPGTPAGTPVDASGCPLPQDDDGDGVTNDIDKCPGTPAGARVDANGCELDSDGDGVVDSKDQCPNTQAGAKVDERGCEVDSDGDGVLDSQDKCPDTPKGDRVDAQGCSFKEEIKLPGVVFETNKAELLPESRPVLEGAIATLKRYPDIKIEVAGHTDSRGSDAYNLDLSARRAATVLKYLQDGGVTNSMTSRGHGERQPVASNNTDDGRQTNRRVVLRVLN